jgi:hypothetical protein
MVFKKGRERSGRKLTCADAISIRSEHQCRPGENARLAEKYGVSKRTIIAIMSRESWKDEGTKTPQIPEREIQKGLVNLLRMNLRKDVRFFHVANERDYDYGAPGAGVSAGVPDIIFVLPDGQTRWLELKTPAGRMSDAQKDWHDFLEQSGHRAAVTYSLEEAIKIVAFWGLFKSEVRIAA